MSIVPVDSLDFGLQVLLLVQLILDLSLKPLNLPILDLHLSLIEIIRELKTLGCLQDVHVVNTFDHSVFDP